MLRNFNLRALGVLFRGLSKDPKSVVRAVIGTLLVANLAAAWLVYRPWGGSAEDLQRELSSLQAQLQKQQQTLDRSKELVTKVEKGRSAGDKFIDEYFLVKRVAYSNVMSDLDAAAKEAQLKPRPTGWLRDVIEGSDDLGMLTITYNCEGTYSDLIHFVQRLDRAQRLILIESLQAAPQQQSGGVLSITLRLQAFLRKMDEPDLSPEAAVSEQ